MKRFSRKYRTIFDIVSVVDDFYKITLPKITSFHGEERKNYTLLLQYLSHTKNANIIKCFMYNLYVINKERVLTRRLFAYPQDIFNIILKDKLQKNYSEARFFVFTERLCKTPFSFQSMFNYEYNEKFWMNQETFYFHIAFLFLSGNTLSYKKRKKSYFSL